MISRRNILRTLGTTAVGGAAAPCLSAQAQQHFHHRQLGRTGRWIVPFGLGGQGALQWTPEGVDPVAIIVRAVELGVNYLDTANSYGPSQANLGKALRALKVVPGSVPFNGALRERLVIASKTRARFARDPENPEAETAITDLKRSLTMLFGDGQGGIPRGAYLDGMQIENLETLEHVDQIYEGFDTRESGKLEKTGALAGLLDYRDGTNYTGLNPDHRIHLRHIGITGHRSSLILMNALQRDTQGVLDTLLIPLNPNDRHYCAHQNNVLPVALAKGVGVIAMKIFAGGVFYGSEPAFARSPEDLVQTVGGGRQAVLPWDLVRYPVSLPGVSCAIAGVGSIRPENPAQDQLTVNLTAALSDLAGTLELRKIERQVRTRHGTATNYFQERSTGLVQPGGINVTREDNRLRVSWQTALAGEEPIRSYVVAAGVDELLRIPFRPQTTLEPLSVTIPAENVNASAISVIASNLPPWARP